jgi:hypothetical protein
MNMGVAHVRHAWQHALDSARAATQTLSAQEQARRLVIDRRVAALDAIAVKAEVDVVWTAKMGKYWEKAGLLSVADGTVKLDNSNAAYTSFITPFESEMPTMRSIEVGATSKYDEHPFACANCTEYSCPKQY